MAYTAYGYQTTGGRAAIQPENPERARLPQDRAVTDRPAGFWARHHDNLMAAALILLLLILASQALTRVRIRRAEAVLRRSEERYRYIYEATAVAIREEDYNRVKSMIDAEKARSGKDFVQFLNDISRIKETEAKLKNYQLRLEDLVKERTAELDHAVAALQSSLREIGETQAQLAKSEKMAALGGLVAGVAHEINTPIGIGVTAVSFLQDEARRLRKHWSGSVPGRQEMDAFMETVTEISTTVLSSLKRAAELVHSFKQVAVDQTVEERRTINMARYIDALLLTLTPKYKKTAHTITVHCPPGLELETYPGAISQIITNLVMNSLIHGFEAIPKGDILITVAEKNDVISLCYNDNGRGMDATTLARAFEHFFTTNRKHGGTGLGLNIVHNLVTRQLGGTIECTSEPGKGVVFTIQVPRRDRTDASLAAASDMDPPITGDGRGNGGQLNA